MQPDIFQAFSAAHLPAVQVRSMSPAPWCFTASPVPRIFTEGRFSFFAISERARISAPPPSVITQQSKRCRGEATIGEFTTSSTVTTSFSSAWGLCWAWWEAATLIQASCSEVVPYSYMCRWAASA